MQAGSTDMLPIASLMDCVAGSSGRDVWTAPRNSGLASSPRPAPAGARQFSSGDLQQFLRSCRHQCCRRSSRISSSGSNSGNGSSTPCGAAAGTVEQGLTADEEKQRPKFYTKFVAETLLPTQYGKFRLRGYRHTVRVVLWVWNVLTAWRGV